MFPFALLLSYLIGAIPFGVLIGRARGVDVRAVGSGNIGATNVLRTLGPVAGGLTLVLDVAKGFAGPVFARLFLQGEPKAMALCGLAAVMGHTFSCFLKFKGGKGIATSLGALLGLMPFTALCALGVWLIILAATRMVGAASISACIALPILAWQLEKEPIFQGVALVLAIVAFIKHIPNLKRIMAGTEPKLGEKKGSSS